jgi:anaerobic selenocysteine-containing dehydrogenase
VYKATVQPGKAWLKALDFTPPHEEPDAEYPLRYTTGRTAYHFHTRTKTGRSRRLNSAAPEPWIEMSVEDAARVGCQEGDIARVTSRRGSLEVPVRVGDIRPGTVFAPFHYGYWDVPDAGSSGGASVTGGAAAGAVVGAAVGAGVGAAAGAVVGAVAAGLNQDDGRHRAANELTITEWDPVSKQPVFKNAAVRVEKLRSGDGPSKAPDTTASRRATGAQR